MMMKNAVFVTLLATIATMSSHTVLAESPASCPSTSTFGLSKKQQKKGCSSSTSSTAAATTATSISRGGAGLLEPATYDEVSAIVLKAKAEDKLVVLNFCLKDWSACYQMNSLFKDIAADSDVAVWVKIDISVNYETAHQYHAGGLPTFIFVKGGEEVDRFMGTSRKKLMDGIKKYM